MGVWAPTFQRPPSEPRRKNSNERRENMWDFYCDTNDRTSSLSYFSRTNHTLEQGGDRNDRLVQMSSDAERLMAHRPRGALCTSSCKACWHGLLSTKLMVNRKLGPSWQWGPHSDRPWGSHVIWHSGSPWLMGLWVWSTTQNDRTGPICGQPGLHPGLSFHIFKMGWVISQCGGLGDGAWPGAGSRSTVVQPHTLNMSELEETFEDQPHPIF